MWAWDFEMRLTLLRTLRFWYWDMGGKCLRVKREMDFGMVIGNVVAIAMHYHLPLLLVIIIVIVCCLLTIWCWWPIVVTARQ